MSIAEEDMSEKDPAIKLFGRKIPLPECQIPATSPAASQIPANSQTMDVVEGVCEEKCEQENEEKGNSINPMEDHKTEEASSTDQDKVMKKPDKIVPCPRCNSLETKFCYFNNYNVNQPRHFCKNCQRYWTAGGTMRNVPVGAGRRKNKHHLASQFRQIIVSSSSSSSDGIIPNTIAESSAASWSSSDNNGIVLKFGPDAPPLCESMETMLNLRDKKTNVEAENGKEPSLCGQKEPCVVSNELNTNNNNQRGVAQMVRGLCSFNQVGMERHPLEGLPPAMGPTVPEGLVTRSALVDTQSKTISTNNNTSNHLQCYPVLPWMFPWNNPQSSAPMPWYPTPMVVVPGMCPPNISLPYWGGTPVWAAGTGMVSIGSNCCLSPSSSSTSNNCCSSNGSPTLGKHSRDTVFTEEDKSEKCVLVPKTLRIDDPNEASKSPIWAALGIKPDKKDCEEAERGSAGSGDKGKDRVLGVSQILEANPAAISRAHAFQESI